MHSRTIPTAAALLCALVVTARAQLVPLGGDVQVNTYTTNAQSGSAVSAAGDGSFVVVWSSYEAAVDPSAHSVQGQRYDAAGQAVGTQFQANTYMTGTQSSPAVAVARDGSGSFVVVWHSAGSSGTDTDNLSIQAQRYDGTGAPLGMEFQVNTYTSSGQTRPDVAADASGNFVIVWTSDGSTGTDADGGSIQARRYDASGVPLGGEFQVNTYTTSQQSVPVVAMTDGGSFVVVWGSEGSDGTDTSDVSIQAQRYDAAGVADGTQFQVNSHTPSYQTSPAVAADPTGFIIAWHSDGSGGTDTSGTSIHGRRYDASGASVAEFQANTYTTGFQGQPSVVLDPTGIALLTWDGPGAAGSDIGSSSIHVRRFDALGSPIEPELQVNAYTTGPQSEPSVADVGGSFVVTWSSSLSPTDTSYSIQHRRIAPGRTILGKKLLVKNPGGESQRGVVVLGKETSTDIGPAIAGDPVTNGATLRLVTAGAVDSDQTYVLDAAGWSAAGSAGFKYSGPTGFDGDPVRKVIFKRTPGGTALLKAIVKGSVGTQSLNVLPPNPGDEGVLVLTIHGGGTYCAAFGGAAGGTEVKDDNRLWKVTNATAEACPTL